MNAENSRIPDELRALLSGLAREYAAILGDALTGVYVHGSIAFGCFRWDRGDVDFLVVVNRPPTQAEKERMIRWLLEADAACPPKGFEMSVVLEDVCRSFRYPTPYELHYSNGYRDRSRADLHGLCASLHGEDRDLAAHFTVTRAVGFPLCGAPVAAVFGPVPRADYLDSILWDVESAEDEIDENPAYFALNLCRVAAYLEDGAVVSKAGGGAWALERLEGDLRPVAEAALRHYTDGAPMDADPEALRRFARRMLARIRAAGEGHRHSPRSMLTW